MKYKAENNEIHWIGSIPETWAIKRIKHVADTSSGTTPDTSDYSYYDQGTVPWIQVKDLYRTDRVFSSHKSVTAKALRDYSVLKIFKPPYVAVAMYASVGNTSVIEIESCVNQACCAIEPHPNVDLNFVFYALAAAKANLISKAQGGTQLNISQQALRNEHIPIPPLEEQTAISEFLGRKTTAIDRAIEIIQSQLTTIQEYKKNLINEVVTKGLDKSKPVKSSGVEWIGKIPTHWRVNKLRYLASLESGATPSKDVLGFWEGDIPWVSSREVKADVLNDTSLHISNEAVLSCSTRILPKETVVMVVRSGILQHTVPVAILGRPMTVNQDVKALTFRSEVLPKYFLYFVKGNNDNLLKVLLKDKSTVDNIELEYLKSLRIPLPPLDEQLAIIEHLDKATTELDSAFRKKSLQLEHLKQARESLIYEYVTGKKRMSGKSELWF